MTGAEPSRTASDLGELAAQFVALNDFLYTGGDRDTALERLVGMAVGSVPGCDWAALTTWPENRRPRSLATSGEVAEIVDHVQYELQEGPCLAAALQSGMAIIQDTSSDEQWPKFSAAVTEQTPVRAVLSYHVADEPDRCALNLYSDRSKAFDREALNVAALFAAHARILLVHAASAGKAANLQTALATSRQIGAAMGILMHANKITADQAFDLLRSTSQRLHRKLNDIAFDVTQTGVLPESSR